MNVQVDDETEQETEQQCRNLRVRTHRRDSLAEGRVVQREDNTEHQVGVPAAVGGEADGPIPTDEEEGRPS